MSTMLCMRVFDPSSSPFAYSTVGAESGKGCSLLFEFYVPMERGQKCCKESCGRIQLCRIGEINHPLLQLCLLFLVNLLQSSFLIIHLFFTILIFFTLICACKVFFLLHSYPSLVSVPWFFVMENYCFRFLNYW